MALTSIEEMLAEILTLPLGTIRALTNFDLRAYIKERADIADKDKARILGFLPAVLQRAADLGVSVGVQIGLKEALQEGLEADNVAVELGEGFDQLVKEGIAIISAFYNQVKRPTSDGLDPFKDEREALRVFCKRNGLNEAYQVLCGVSDNTKTEYEAEFIDKYLS